MLKISCVTKLWRSTVYSSITVYIEVIRIIYVWTITKHKYMYPGLDFIIKDLPSVLILIIADQRLNESRCCCNKFQGCQCRYIDKQYILLLLLLKYLSEIYVSVHEVCWIKLNLVVMVITFREYFE